MTPDNRNSSSKQYTPYEDKHISVHEMEKTGRVTVLPKTCAVPFMYDAACSWIQRGRL